jgi:uncharacterized membrane protein
MSKLLILSASICVLFAYNTPAVFAQAVLHQDLKETVAAEVLFADEPSTRIVPGTETEVNVQEITVSILEGTQKGRTVTFDNEMVPVEDGEHIFINYVKTFNGDEYFILMDVDRRGELFALALLFVILLLWFAGMQGLRALFSLGVSIAAIIFLLVPALLNGWNPALASLGIASIILAVVLFGTHGIKPRIVISFAGTYIAVIITCALAYFFTDAMKLSGLSSDEAVFLNFATRGSLDFSGLLLGSIIIGILGILDDVSITQASVVQELKAANPKLSIRELYTRAIRVGRDHVGSLVNTLALAYVGVSLPLILLFVRAESTISLTLNQEIVAVEIVRIIVGSIGLILAVPLTTIIAAWYFGKQTNIPHEEMHHCGHRH